MIWLQVKLDSINSNPVHIYQAIMAAGETLQHLLKIPFTFTVLCKQNCMKIKYDKSTVSIESERYDKWEVPKN